MVNEEKATVEESPKQRSKSRGVAVDVISVTGQSALVERFIKDKVQRVTVPLSIVKDGKVSPDDLAAGIPYGVPWEEVEFQKLDPKDVANALRISGFWTYDDISKNPHKAMGILQSHYRIDVGALNTFASEFEKKKE